MSAGRAEKVLQNAKKGLIMNGFYNTKVPGGAVKNKVFQSDFETKRSSKESKLVDHKGT